ncbi:MAG: hypothetical protein R3Y09_01460 [Clostridia bacterium]
MAKKGLTVRFDEEMLHKLHIIADYEGRSANGQVIVLVRDLIKEYEEKNGKIEIK